MTVTDVIREENAWVNLIHWIDSRSCSSSSYLGIRQLLGTLWLAADMVGAPLLWLLAEKVKETQPERRVVRISAVSI